MLLYRWRVQMLGGLKASWGTQILTEFKSQKVASLLAYLAFYPSVPHSRDALQTLLWPEDDLDAVRNRLRVSLSSLRRQMEPPGTPERWRRCVGSWTAFRSPSSWQRRGRGC